MSEADITFDDCFISFPVQKGDWIMYFSEHLGERRFQDICRRMKVNIEKKLLERDLAKIIIGSSDVKREDIQEVLTKKFTPILPVELLQKIRNIQEVEDLPSEVFHELYQRLASPFSYDFKVNMHEKSIEDSIHKAWHFAYSSIKFDPYWFTKKRLHILLEGFKLDLHLYYERLASFYVACEDLEVGCYLPAPTNTTPNYYKVSAILVTGGGQIGMFLAPATKSMDLLPIRITRGTPAAPSGLDLTSHLITDMERDIGKMGYESGLPYQEVIHNLYKSPHVELGYSIGGTIAQWRAADCSNNIHSLWLFKSPGVPREIYHKFNTSILQRTEPLDVHIFSAKRDFIDLTGEYILGYNAPSNVRLHLYLMSIPRPNPHRYGFVDPIKMKLTKIPDSQIDAFFQHRSRIFIEKSRKRIGKHFILPFVRFFNKIFGKLIDKRVKTQIGLWYEARDESGWTILRYLPK